MCRYGMCDNERTELNETQIILFVLIVQMLHEYTAQQLFLKLYIFYFVLQYIIEQIILIYVLWVKRISSMGREAEIMNNKCVHV